MSVETAYGFRGQRTSRVVELRGLEEALRSLDPRIVERAARPSINKAAKAGRTEASTAIRDKFHLPAARVNKEVKNLSMARTGQLSATIRAAGRPISLTAFGAKYVRNAYGRARTTTAKKSTVSKRSSRKTGVFVTIDKRSGKQHFPYAFMARGKRGGGDGGYGQGGLLVFYRNRRGGLTHQAAITLASMFAQRHVQIRVMNKIGKVWDKEFPRQLERLMK